MTDINTSDSNHQQASSATASTHAISQSETALWSFTGIELIDASDELTLLLSTASEQRLLVRKEVAIALTHCEAYRTLRGHAEHLVATLPQLGGQVEPVIPVLAQIRDAGLLREGATSLRHLTTSVEKSSLAPVQVFIITCDRPAAVERLLTSMAGSAALGLPEAYTLIDDSRDAALAEANQALVEAHNAKASFHVRYFGLEAREQLLAHLIATEPQHEDSIRFLLDRQHWGDLPTYGLSRSLALLLGVGSRVMIFDDDVLCEAVRSPLPEEPLHFGGISSRKAVFWSNDEDQEAAKKGLKDSPIALMARQLGSTLSEGIGTLSHGELPDVALKGANGAFVRSLKPESPILQTQCSTWGDPGTGSGHWISELDVASVDRLLEVPGGLVNTVDARAAWLGYDGPTLTKHGVMSQLTGYDASHLLPPFMPAFRGEDSLFAFMLLTLHPNSLVLNYSWAVPHRPLERRTSRSLKVPIAAQGGIALLTRWIGDNVQLSQAHTPTERLNTMAQGIDDLTRLSEADLQAFARTELANWQASQAGHFRRQLAQAPALQSANWQQYLERGHEEVFTALQQTPSWNDLLGHAVEDPTHTLSLLRSGGQRLSNALKAWPLLWAAAASFDFQ
jgi:hypothetical protein